MMTRALLKCGSGVALLVSLSGCGGSAGPSPDTRASVTISGVVKAGGKPIESDHVHLILKPSDGIAVPGLKVGPGGAFSGRAIAGKNHVIIDASMTPDAGHGDGPKIGIGSVFMSGMSPLTVDVAEGAKLEIEVGVEAAKKFPDPSQPSTPKAGH